MVLVANQAPTASSMAASSSSEVVFGLKVDQSRPVRTGCVDLGAQRLQAGDAGLAAAEAER